LVLRGSLGGQVDFEGGGPQGVIDCVVESFGSRCGDVLCDDLFGYPLE
jgi:hypothetical protein